MWLLDVFRPSTTLTKNSKFPKEYKVLETIDNGEFVTATVFQIDRASLSDFVKLNYFDTLKPRDVHIPLLLFSGTYFKEYKPDFNYKENILYVQGTRGKNNLTCVADLKK